jgi:small ligand-binding sensory domain FIST
MSLATSSQFASIIETGSDWRDTAKKVLEKLESIRTDEDSFNIGFLYVSDYLADNFSSILTLFKSVLNIEIWVGSVAMGVCGNGVEYIDKPAISVMIGHIPDELFCLIPPSESHSEISDPELEGWLGRHEPMLVLTHGDPMMNANPNDMLRELDELTGGFMVGGLASSRSQHSFLAGTIGEDGLGGIVLSHDIPVATSLTQGCIPFGETLTITRCHEHSVLEINGQPALDIFKHSLENFAQSRQEQYTGQPSGDEQSAQSDKHTIFKGEVHAAFPVPASDQGDYLVRNIISIDEERKALNLAQIPSPGDHIIFVHRDNQTVRQDLSATLCKLQKRLQRENDGFQAKGALYISCVARAFNDFNNTGVHESEFEKGGEMALVREIIGDIPLTGFYASGEINAARLYGYTSILILFL